jgi:2-dehydro-3-deoxy-D-arabinonate dehydratase
MSAIKLLRFRDEARQPRLGLTEDWEAGVVDVTRAMGVTTIPEWADTVQGSGQEPVHQALQLLQSEPRRPVETGAMLLPLDCAELWAAGVTYERSRDAREEETTSGHSIYDLVYDAPRPELFFKAPAGRIAGPGEPVGLRRDATWHVPEPELTVILGPRGEVFGYTVGNDLTARDLEAKNPLYLPQAKLFHGSAAIGPAVALAATVELEELVIRLRIRRRGSVVFAGETSATRLHRSIGELVAYLGQEWPLRPWTGLMTGTGIVPPDYFALEDGDEIAIEIPPIGTLVNSARRIGAGWAPVTPAPPRLLRIDPRDNVAVALGQLPAGFQATLDDGTTVTLEESVPFGHKVALAPLAPGEPVIKYGAVIGVASAAILPGQYAHTHNIEGTRGRGDLQAANPPDGQGGAQ